MASIKKLQPNQIVWDVQRTKMGNTTATIGSLYQVQITEVSLDTLKVLASWNRNPARWYDERSIKKWKVNKPEPKGKVFGQNSY